MDNGVVEKAAVVEHSADANQRVADTDTTPRGRGADSFMIVAAVSSGILASGLNIADNG